MDVFLDTTSPTFLKEMNKGLDLLSEIVEKSYKQPDTEDKVTVDDVQAVAVMKYKFHEVQNNKTAQESSSITKKDLRSTKGNDTQYTLS